jgi:hypothetical protein
MTSKNRKLTIGISVSVIVIGISYLFYKRNINKRNSELMLEYINGFPVENSTVAQNVIQNKATDLARVESSGTLSSLTKYKVKLVALDNKWYNLANLSQRKTAIEIALSIAKELNAAMNRVGTDKIKFDRNFIRIQSNGAFILVNSIYTSLYKQDLWKAIEGEEVLYKGAGNGWNATVGSFWDLPNYDVVISTQAKLWNTLEQKLNAK